jgi:hypothetical protein
MSQLTIRVAIVLATMTLCLPGKATPSQGSPARPAARSPPGPTPPARQSPSLAPALAKCRECEEAAWQLQDTRAELERVRRAASDALAQVAILDLALENLGVLPPQRCSPGRSRSATCRRS